MVQLTKDYGKKVTWNVGTLFAHDGYMFKLHDVLTSLGYEDPVNSVFGSIPCLFQGGRIPPRDAKTEDALNIFDEYNKRGIGCRLTFSNTLLKENDLDDKLCNELLQHLNMTSTPETKNGVIVASDMLAKYILDKYPNLQLISSQVKPSVEVGLDNDDAGYYNNLFDLYDVVVVNPFKVNDGQFLHDIRYPERVEFIANHRCVPNCPVAKKHYEIQMEIGMKFIKGENVDKEVAILQAINDNCLKTKASYPMAGTSLGETEIESLIRMGYTQFKLEGRDNEGVTMIRDMGQYMFQQNLYNRIASAIMREPV